LRLTQRSIIKLEPPSQDLPHINRPSRPDALASGSSAKQGNGFREQYIKLWVAVVTLGLNDYGRVTRAVGSIHKDACRAGDALSVPFTSVPMGI